MKPGSVNSALTIVALVVTGIGSGSLKPCVSSIGGDQFEESGKIVAFFAIFYGIINFGSLVAFFLTPILREESCFGRFDCFFLVFAMATGLMVLSLVVILLGRKQYLKKQPTGRNLFAYFVQQTFQRIRRDRKIEQLEEKVDNDAANFRYVYKLMVVFIPLPFYWALAEMKGILEDIRPKMK